MFLSKILDISARKGAKFNKFISEFCPNLAKMISFVTMATNVDSKLLTIVFLFLSGTDHSVKFSSNSESVRARALLEFYGGYRELMLSRNYESNCLMEAKSHMGVDGLRAHQKMFQCKKTANVSCPIIP